MTIKLYTRIKQYIAVLMAAAFISFSGFSASGEENKQERTYSGCYVLMESSTGTVVRERDGDKRVRMGSMNKLMAVLLAAEAVCRGELEMSTVLTASEYANSMQGAQIWLMPGEKMTLSDLLKGVIIGNANDAVCVIAEKIGGTEEKFTELMNRRAKELGMNDTLFTNSNGYYDDDKQYTTARNAALLLRELSKHEFLTEIFTTRIDELKDGEVELVTTNRPGHKYKGSVGFKCGTGPNSGYFAAEGAQRNGICFVAAVLDCEEEDFAMALACELMDIGFSGYSVIDLNIPDNMPDAVSVKQGCTDSVGLSVEDFGKAVVPKGREDSVEARIFLPSYVYAPLKKGDKIGEVKLYLGNRLVKTCEIHAKENVCEKNFINVLIDMLKFIVKF